MMDKFDKILQIFESQKDEISKMTNKINNLEKTNLFLMKFIEKKNDLSAVCDLTEIQRYKDLAVDRELTLNSARDKAHIDATICETSLNSSFECPERPDDKNLIQICDSTPHVMSPILSKVGRPSTSTNFLNDTIINFQHKSSLSQFSKSNSLQLRQSSQSPTRRNVLKNRNILSYNEHSNVVASLDRSQSSDEKKDTVIIRSVQDAIKTSKDLSSSNHSDKLNMLQRSSSSHNGHEEMSSSNILLNNDDDNKLKDAIDHLIKTLEQRKMRVNDSSESSFSDQLKQILHPKTIEQLVSTKDSILSDLDDKHTQMKLLLNSQQLKADLFHKSLKTNNEKIINVGHQILQHNSSNKIKIMVVEDANNGNKVKKEIEDSREVSSNLVPSFSNFKNRRQKELDRLNNNLRDQALLNPKVKKGFEKFTALIKGYIIRTLLETDKVRSVIMTIKDTAQIALKIRQERLSGDCAQPGDSSYNTGRRNYQETISFQHRLLSQLRSALNELHEIFFVWSSSSKMNLLRNHINQLISSATKYQVINESTEEGPSNIGVNKTKKAAPLSSATIKRRQNMALRSASSTTKDNGNAKSSSNQRKSIYANIYGCRGHGAGSYSRTSNGQSKSGNERRSRPNNISHRRNAVRQRPDVNINTVSSSSKPNTGTTTFDLTKSNEPGNSNAISNITFKVTKREDEQQQQRWISPKTITTSICSQAAGDGYPYKAGFITAMLGKKHCIYDEINVHQDSEENEGINVSANSALLPENTKTQANTNNFNGGSDKYNTVNGKRNEKDGPIFMDNSPSIKDNGYVEYMFSKVEVDIGEIEYDASYKNNFMANKFNDISEYSEYSNNIDNVVLVDICQKSSESDSIVNDLKSTYNSNTNHWPNKPTVTVGNTRYSHSRLKPSVVPMPHFSKHIPISVQCAADFDLSSSNNNILPYRTFKIKKRIIACSNKHP